MRWLIPVGTRRVLKHYSLVSSLKRLDILRYALTDSLDWSHPLPSREPTRRRGDSMRSMEGENRNGELIIFLNLTKISIYLLVERILIEFIEMNVWLTCSFEDNQKNEKIRQELISERTFSDNELEQHFKDFVQASKVLLEQEREDYLKNHKWNLRRHCFIY